MVQWQFIMQIISITNMEQLDFMLLELTTGPL